MTPIDRLNAVAADWCADSGRSLARLATLVVNDGKFFERLGEVGKTTTTATLDKFARYFLDPVNWSGGEIPPAANDFAQVMGVRSSAHETGDTAGGPPESPDNEDPSIGANAFGCLSASIGANGTGCLSASIGANGSSCLSADDPIGHTVPPVAVSDHAGAGTARDEESPGEAAVAPVAAPGDLFGEPQEQAA